MGNQLSVEASDILEKTFSKFLLVEGGSPLRLDIITALRKRFPGATTEHFYPDSPEMLEGMRWSNFDLVLISCPSSICAELSWLNVIKERNTLPGGPILIVLTGSAQTGRDAIWEGADVYLPHEVTKVEFSARLDAALEVERLFRRYPLILPDWHMLEVLHNSENAVIFLAEDRTGQKAVVKRFKCDVSGVSEDVLQRFF